MCDNHNHTELHEKLSRLQWLLQRHHILNHAEHGPMADPTRGQGRVLALLKLQPEISTKDLSYVLGIRQQSLNELLNKLEKGGYVTRTPSEADRRVMMVRLTEKGENQQRADTDLGDVFSCLSQEEQTAFAGYLDRVVAALEAQLGDEDSDEMENWMRAARSRMGNEQFDRLMSMGGGMRPHHRHGGFGGMWGGRPGRMGDDGRFAQGFGEPGPEGFCRRRGENPPCPDGEPDDA